MKKSIVTILIVALAIALGTGLVFAASSPEASYAKVAGWNCAGGAGCGYVDADGDGVCDNYGTAACNHGGAAGGARGSGLQNGYGHHGENHGGGHCGRF